jgi:universal stress protein E
MTRQKIRTIVVGVAESRENRLGLTAPTEDPVLAPAAAFADRLGATLHVVQAFERMDPWGAKPMQGPTALHRQRVEIEQRLWGQTRAYPGAGRIHSHAVEGDAAIQLCAFAEEVGADLIIVGASRRFRARRELLGSTAERVLQRSPVPVLVMRRHFASPVGRVVLTTDLADLSPALHEAALDAVESLFDTEALQVRALVVYRYDMVTASRLSPLQMTQAVTARLDDFLAHRRGRMLPVQGKVRIGNPSTEIIRESDDWSADLLVVGSHGGRGFARWLLGSTAAATLQGTKSNVLVIPAAWAAAHADRAGEADTDRTASGFPGTEEHHDAGALLATV